MGKTKPDGRSRYRGHDAPRVAGGKRLVAAYMDEEDYSLFQKAIKKREVSASSFAAAAINTAVKRALR